MVPPLSVRSSIPGVPPACCPAGDSGCKGTDWALSPSAIPKGKEKVNGYTPFSCRSTDMGRWGPTECYTGTRAEHSQSTPGKNGLLVGHVGHVSKRGGKRRGGPLGGLEK